MPAPKPAFSYTIGLTEHGLPELALAGLKPVVSRGILNRIGKLMRDSGSFREGQIINNALSDGMPVGFALTPLVVVTQTLIELVAMVVMVALVPRVVRAD